MDLVLNAKTNIRECPFDLLKEELIRGSIRLSKLLKRNAL